MHVQDMPMLTYKVHTTVFVSRECTSTTSRDPDSSFGVDRLFWGPHHISALSEACRWWDNEEEANNLMGRDVNVTATISGRTLEEVVVFR